MADKLYHEWLDLANIVSDLNDWTESDWNNFNICMSLAESCKNRVDSISYALQGLGWEFDKNSYGTIDGNNIFIRVSAIYTPPRMDQIRSKLARCVEYLVLVKDPSIDFRVDDANIFVEITTGSTSNDVIDFKKGISLEATLI